MKETNKKDLIHTHGLARQGVAWRGEARQGMARQGIFFLAN